MISRNDIFALVHIDYSGIQILEIGDRKFILEKYFWWKEKFEIVQEGMNQGDPAEDLCIQGYDGDTVECVCNNFDVSISKVKGL